MNSYYDRALELFHDGETNKTEIAKQLISEFKLDLTVEQLRRRVSHYLASQKDKALSEECERQGIPMDQVKQYWFKGKHFSINVKGSDEKMTWDDVKDGIIAEMKAHAPKYPAIARANRDSEGHLLVIDPADVHIGKLSMAFETGDDYDSNIAVQRVREGVQGILDKARGFNIDKILFIGGNDILHIDTPRRTTTSGTPQDTDGMWYSNFLLAKKLYVEILEMLMTVADVHFTYNPSNHDYTNGFFLADSIQSWFCECRHITFDCSLKHRKYYEYGNSLIGTTHGDGAKTQDLPLLMAQESSESWANTKHRYVYTHHVHHKTSKDFIGVTVESLRSPSGTDGWHHRNGYQHNPKAIEGFIHSKYFGQVARLTHVF